MSKFYCTRQVITACLQVADRVIYRTICSYINTLKIAEKNNVNIVNGRQLKKNFFKLFIINKSIFSRPNFLTPYIVRIRQFAPRIICPYASNAPKSGPDFLSCLFGLWERISGDLIYGAGY